MSTQYEEESKRLTCLNQRFAFLMNGIQVIKIRQAGGDKDMALELLGKRTEKELDDMIRKELGVTDKSMEPLGIV